MKYLVLLLLTASSLSWCMDDKTIAQIEWRGPIGKYEDTNMTYYTVCMFNGTLQRWVKAGEKYYCDTYNGKAGAQIEGMGIETEFERKKAAFESTPQRSQTIYY